MIGKKLVLVGFILIISGCVQSVRIVKPGKPIINFQPSTTILEPGHVINLSVQADQPDLIIKAIGWWEKELELFPIPVQPLQYEHYVAIPLEMDPGDYAINIIAQSKKSNNQSIEEKIITVKPRSKFKVARLWIKFLDKYDFKSESLIMTKAREASSVKNMSKINNFLWPVKGRLSERFGVKRIYNNGLKSWYHGGLDIAVPGGTIIKAPADGVVILSKDFIAHGKTILIDHGYGVITTYLHQRQRLVEKGDEVKRGQPIGRVGTTGSSTGNHLHFQVNVNNVIADPFDFLESIKNNNQKN